MIFKNLRLLAILSVFTIVIVFSFSAQAAVHFITKKDAVMNSTETKPCQVLGYTYTKSNCPDGKILSNQCPSNAAYYKTCGCDTKNKFTSSSCKAPNVLSEGCNNTYFDKCGCDEGVYKFDSSNCQAPKVLAEADACTAKIYSGSSIVNGAKKYKSCSCPSTHTKTCSGNMVPTNSNEGCDNKYASCKCNPSKFTISKCDHGAAAGTTTCTEENGSVKYQACKAEVKCDAPYYVDSESKCALWDGVAAVAKTCNELITITKNGNITGNVLVWGTLNCANNQIVVPQGQNIVGRAFFKGKYPEATDANTNKFSKVTWEFADIGNALSVEHNTKLSDLTLSGKSTTTKAVNLVYSNGKQNLVFQNVDFHGTVEDGTINVLQAVSQNSAFEFKGNSYIRTDAPADKGNPYWIYQGKMALGQDAVLNIVGNGGVTSGINQVSTTMTKNAIMNIKTSGRTYSMVITGDDMNAGVKLGSLVMKDTAKINADVANAYKFIEVPLTMSNDTIINAKVGGTFHAGDSAFGTKVPFTMNDNARVNAIAATLSYQIRDIFTMNGNSSAYFKSISKPGKSTIIGPLVLNSNAKLIIEANDHAGGSMDGYYGAFNTPRAPTMNGSSKLYISSNDYIFTDAKFELNSASAIIYAKQTNASRKIFGGTSSNPEVWLYKTVAGARIAIETPGQMGYGGAEDDGLYLMPALGVSASDGASICSHMTSGYSSSKVNRDLACWTHDRDANPNNNDFLKGKVCNRCSDGYKLSGVTHVSKSDSRFTTVKTDFDKEMSTNASIFSNFLTNVIP